MAHPTTVDHHIGFAYILCGFGDNGQGSSSTLNDVWYANLNDVPLAWKLLVTPASISIRDDHSTVFSQMNRVAYTFGGSGEIVLSDVWALNTVGQSECRSLPFVNLITASAGNWTKFHPAGPQPTVRYSHTAVLSDAGIMYITCGATSYNTLLSDTWAFDPVAVTWTRLADGVYGRYSGVAAYYGPLEVMYVTGGYDTIHQLNDMWCYSILSNKWYKLDTAGYSARSESSIAIDTQHSLMYVIAGNDYMGKAQSDVWVYSIQSALNGEALLWAYNILTLSNAGTWTQVLTGTIPSRFGHTSVFTNTGSGVYVMGGMYGTPIYTDTWLLSSTSFSTGKYIYPSTAPSFASSTQPTVSSTIAPSTQPSLSPSLASSTSSTQPTVSSTLAPSTRPTLHSTPFTISPSLKPSTPPSLYPSFAVGAVAASGTDDSAAVVSVVVVLAVLAVTTCLSWYLYRRWHRSKSAETHAVEDSKQALLRTGPDSELAHGSAEKRPDTVEEPNAPAAPESWFNGGSVLESDSVAFPLPGPVTVPSIAWSSLIVPEELESATLGKGSFGLVLRALWSPAGETTAGSEVVAVKLLMNVTAKSYEKALRGAEQEVRLVREVAAGVQSNCVVRAHGVAAGPVGALGPQLNLAEGMRAIGIVLRYEGGGSLRTLIHKTDRTLVPLPLLEKFRLLKQISRGLAELHAIGVVHADIKPDNVLLSEDNPPEIRLADFGLSILRQPESALVASTLVETSHLRGTPLYCAPEMLYNPYLDLENMSEAVARPSRKTDVYAFAVLAWELLTEKVPFAQARNDVALSALLHQGYRPSLTELPKDCPRNVGALIEACWATDRAVRLSAAECYSAMQRHYDLLARSEYDIYLSHSPCSSSKQFVAHLAFILMQQGLSVCFEPKQVGLPDMNAVHIDRSKVLLVAISRSYQKDVACLQLLRECKRLQPVPPLMSLFLESNPLSWANQELIYLCQLRSPALQSFDVADLMVLWPQDSDLENLSPALRLRCEERIKKIASDIKNYIRTNYGRTSSSVN